MGLILRMSDQRSVLRDKEELMDLGALSQDIRFNTLARIWGDDVSIFLG